MGKYKIEILKLHDNKKHILEVFKKYPKIYDDYWNNCRPLITKDDRIERRKEIKFYRKIIEAELFDEGTINNLNNVFEAFEKYKTIKSTLHHINEINFKIKTTDLTDHVIGNYKSFISVNERKIKEYNKLKNKIFKGSTDRLLFRIYKDEGEDGKKFNDDISMYKINIESLLFLKEFIEENY